MGELFHASHVSGFCLHALEKAPRVFDSWHYDWLSKGCLDVRRQVLRLQFFLAVQEVPEAVKERNLILHGVPFQGLCQDQILSFLFDIHERDHEIRRGKGDGRAIGSERLREAFVQAQRLVVRVHRFVIAPPSQPQRRGKIRGCHPVCFVAAAGLKVKRSLDLENRAQPPVLLRRLQLHFNWASVLRSSYIKVVRRKAHRFGTSITLTATFGASAHGRGSAFWASLASSSAMSLRTLPGAGRQSAVG